MNVPGPRPLTKPVHHGEFEPERVYLSGDVVTYDGVTWKAIVDFRAGFLSPAIVAADRSGEFWVKQ